MILAKLFLNHPNIPFSVVDKERDPKMRLIQSSASTSKAGADIAYSICPQWWRRVANQDFARQDRCRVCD